MSPPYFKGESVTRIPGDTISTQLGSSFGGWLSPQSRLMEDIIMGPVFDERGNKLNWLLIRLRWLISKLSQTFLQPILCTITLLELRNKTSSHIHNLSTLKTISEITTNRSQNSFEHPRLSKDNMNMGCKLRLDIYADTSCSGNHAYVEEFIRGKTVTAMGFSTSLGKLDTLPYAHILYPYDHVNGSVLLIENNNMKDSPSNPI